VFGARPGEVEKMIKSRQRESEEKLWPATFFVGE